MAKEMTEKDKAQNERSLTKMVLAKDIKAVENEAATNVEKQDILLETALFGRPELRTEAQQL